jgi:hypothetical protein
MTDRAETPEWLRYFTKRPMQALLLVIATFLLFVAIFTFLKDVREIQESHISIEDGKNIIKYTSDSLLVIVPTAIIFFFVGVLHSIEHGLFGPYIAWVVIAVGLILLMIAAVEQDPGIRLIFSNAGWVAFSAGFGFFAGVTVERIHNKEDETTAEDADPPSTRTDARIDAKRRVRKGKH